MSKRQKEIEKTNEVPARAWLMVLALFVTGIAMAYAQNKVMAIIPLVQADLNVGAQVAGWISSIFVVLGIIMAFPAVGIVRKLGLFKSGLISIIITLVGGMLGFFAPEQYTLLASRVLEGFGQC